MSHAAQMQTRATDVQFEKILRRPSKMEAHTSSAVARRWGVRWARDNIFSYFILPDFVQIWHGLLTAYYG
jgi:hypothetical protein